MQRVWRATRPLPRTVISKERLMQKLRVGETEQKRKLKQMQNQKRILECPPPHFLALKKSYWRL